MGLEATVQGAVDTLFATLGDLAGTLTLRRIIEGDYDTPNDYDDTSVIGAFDKVETSVFEESLVQVGDKIVYIKPTDPEPETGDIIIGPDSKEFTIVQLMPFKTYNTVFAWALLVRR